MLFFFVVQIETETEGRTIIRFLTSLCVTNPYFSAVNEVALEKETRTGVAKGVGTESENVTETRNGVVSETVKEKRNGVGTEIENVTEIKNGVESENVTGTGNGVVQESVIEIGTEVVIGTVLLYGKMQECLEDTRRIRGVEKGKRSIHGNGKDTEIIEPDTTNLVSFSLIC